jgi:hypothetical protein
MLYRLCVLSPYPQHPRFFSFTNYYVTKRPQENKKMAIGNLDAPDDTKAKKSDFVSSRFSINFFGDHRVFLWDLGGFVWFP